MQTKVKEQKIDTKELVQEAPKILMSLFTAIDWLAKNNVEDNPAAAHVRASIHALLEANVKPADETLDISFFTTPDEDEDDEFHAELMQSVEEAEDENNLIPHEQVMLEVRARFDNAKKARKGA